MFLVRYILFFEGNSLKKVGFNLKNVGEDLLIR